jgi:hypothetical protein
LRIGGGGGGGHGNIVLVHRLPDGRSTTIGVRVVLCEREPAAVRAKDDYRRRAGRQSGGRRRRLPMTLLLLLLVVSHRSPSISSDKAGSNERDGGVRWAGSSLKGGHVRRLVHLARQRNHGPRATVKADEPDGRVQRPLLGASAAGGARRRAGGEGAAAGCGHGLAAVRRGLLRRAQGAERPMQRRQKHRLAVVLSLALFAAR